MILRDLRCDTCGTIVEDVAVGSLAVTSARLYCAKCSAMSMHRDVGTGGAKLRCFVTDFHARRWSTEETQFLRAGVDSDGEPMIDHKTGELVEAAPRFQPDAVNEQRDKIAHADDRTKGRLPITIDQAKGGK